MVDKLTLADTIREITRTHLEQNNGLLLGQCISAVGWVNNTVPDCKNIVEIPMTDIAGAGMAVGAALVGRRPIFVIRFQDFMILNGGPLIYYAAKLKDVHGRAAPVFIRAIGIDGIGHAHSGVLHSIFMHFPGFRVCAPITSGEYKKIWNDYLKHDDPMYVSEHRSTYQNTQEFEDQFEEGAQITLYGIASARPEVVKAAAILREQEIKCNVVHLLWLKPFPIEDRIIETLRKSKKGLVVDSGFEIAGASQSIAQRLHELTDLPVRAYGLYDKNKSLSDPYKNATPTGQEIAAKAIAWVRSS